MKHLHTKAGCNGDDSFVRLPVPLEFQRALNLPAQRFGYAAVYVNHRYYGFAWVGEEIDDVFLQSRYNHSDGNLYKVYTTCYIKIVKLGHFNWYHAIPW